MPDCVWRQYHLGRRKNELEAFSCDFCSKCWSFECSLSEKYTCSWFKMKTACGKCVCFWSGTPLGRHCRHSHDKMDQAFPLRYCILQAIKNWTVGRSWNEARISAILAYERYSYWLFPTSVGQVLYRQTEIWVRNSCSKVTWWRKQGVPKILGHWYACEQTPPHTRIWKWYSDF